VFSYAQATRADRPHREAVHLTTALAGKNGKHYCVAATWNNTAALDQAKFFATYGSILNTLAKMSEQLRSRPSRSLETTAPQTTGSRVSFRGRVRYGVPRPVESTIHAKT
jgi:hypothetical protein